MSVYANVAFLREMGIDLQLNWLHTLLDNVNRESGNDGVMGNPNRKTSFIDGPWFGVTRKAVLLSRGEWEEKQIQIRIQ